MQKKSKRRYLKISMSRDIDGRVNEWLDAQTNETRSVILALSIIQRVYGNSNLPDSLLSQLMDQADFDNIKKQGLITDSRDKKAGKEESPEPRGQQSYSGPQTFSRPNSGSIPEKKSLIKNAGSSDQIDQEKYNFFSDDEDEFDNL